MLISYKPKKTSKKKQDLLVVFLKAAIFDKKIKINLL